MNDTLNKQAAEEKRLLKNLYQLEDLAEKKTRVYSRLLTEQALAQEMEQLADKHLRRKQILQSLLTGEDLQKQGGMSAMNKQGVEE